MVVIFSDNTDFTTSYVLYWMQYYGIRYIVVTPESKVIFTKFDNLVYTISINGEQISSSTVKGVWYRRGEFSFERVKYKFASKAHMLQSLIESERQSCLFFFHKALEKCPVKIGSYFGNFINRLDVLIEAEKIGLRIPKFIVTTSKSELTKFNLEHRKKGIILKNFSQGVGFSIEERFYKYYTQKIDTAFIDSLPSEFAPSFFMEYFDTLFEIRAFVFLEQVFSMAIISSYAAVDVKKKEQLNQVRYAPYVLPKSISKSLIELVKQLDIETGSVDLLVNKDGLFCFLEINPIGQFGHLSKVCNLYLEKLIAQYFYEKTRV
ncbi:MAG: hypothetical protein JNJ58_08770 [Chitinophagaceae bacterium]|nr:hypothetical protein [Chitinophagaceae bacterium]